MNNCTERTRLTPESKPGQVCPVTTTLEKILLGIIALVVAIGIGLSIALASLYKPNTSETEKATSVHCHVTGHGGYGYERSDDTCYTPACVAEASTLLNSMDTTVNPCDDFYQFVCGNWLKNTHLLSSMESRFTRISKNIILKVKEILEELQKKTEKRPAESSKSKVSKFYKSCTDRISRDEVGDGKLKEDLKTFGGWPLVYPDWDEESFKWEELMVQLFKTGYLSTMLFTVRVGVDPYENRKTLLEVRYPSLGLEKKIFYSLDSITGAYKKTIFKLAKILKPDLKEATSEEDIKKAFEFESKLADAVTEISRDPKHRYHIMTLQELIGNATKIPWKLIFTNMLPDGTVLPDSQKISVTSLHMLETLNNLIAEYAEDEDKKKVLANYMLYRVVLFAAHHLDERFYNLIANLLENQGIPHMPPWDVCLKTTMEFFHAPVTSLYVTKYVDGDTTNSLRNLVRDLQVSLREDIMNAKWLDDETRHHAISKVHHIKDIIGYSDDIMNDKKLDEYYKKLNIDEEKYFENVKATLAFFHEEDMKGLNENHNRMRWPEISNLLMANAYYRANQNSIIIPVGILQRPFFDPDRPNYINYGSLGMIVGHEMTHAFDKIGGLYDERGNLYTWWSPKSLQAFGDVTRCFEEQYNKYAVPEVAARVNGTHTLAENIADNGGVKTAYHAYLNFLKRSGKEKSLPGLKFTERQMFWISFGSIWCKKQTEDSIRFAMSHFYHTPSRFRVIGTVSNSQEFSDDFNCHANMSMNPWPKCTLWD